VTGRRGREGGGGGRGGDGAWWEGGKGRDGGDGFLIFVLVDGVVRFLLGFTQMQSVHLGQ